MSLSSVSIFCCLTSFSYKAFDTQEQTAVFTNCEPSQNRAFLSPRFSIYFICNSLVCCKMIQGVLSEAKYTIFLFLFFEKRFIFNDFLFSLSYTHALPCTHTHWQTRRYHAPAECIKQQDLSPSPYPRWRTAALPVGKQSVYHPSNRMRALSPARLALFLVRCSCEYGARWQDMTPHCVRLGDKLELWGFHSRTKNRYTYTHLWLFSSISLSFLLWFLLSFSLHPSV